LAGVSTATVNRVIKSDGYVSGETRAAVEAVIRTTGYRPNILARNLRTRRSQTIGQMLTSITVNPFFVRVASGVEVAASAAGYRTVLFNHGGDAVQERIGIEGFISQGVEAVLFCTAVARENVDLLAAAGIPAVEIERSVSPSTPFVRVDNRVGARRAMLHLLELGHRRIAFIGGDPNLFSPDSQRGRSVEDDRLGAYYEVLAEAGIAADPELVHLGKYYSIEDGGSGEEGFRHATALLSLPNQPTAIFATCDILAAGVLQALYAAGLKVPQDVSVIGFDDTLASYLTPSLTTVAQPMAELGEAAFGMAIDLIERRPVGAETVLETQLRLGSSSVKR
jgi:LacI family transcriptional regulator